MPLRKNSLSEVWEELFGDIDIQTEECTLAQVKFDNVSKVYPDGTRAVEGLSMEVADGEFMVFVGPSGCGKTTALRMVAGLEEISKGTLSIGGVVVNDLDCGERDIAMVFQNYALYPHMSVFENLNFPLKLSGMPREERIRRIRNTARMLGIEAYLKRKPGRLSGGQRQRVAMGRALVREPLVFLMDEPLSNLDAKLRVQTRGEISNLQREVGTTTIYVTHDQTEALTMGDRIAVIRDGRLQQVADPATLYEHPANLFVAAFIGAPPMNLLEGKLSRRDGNCVLRIGPHKLELHDDEVRGVSDSAAVVVGVRPEKLEVQCGNGHRSLLARVVHRESIGSDLFLTTAIDGIPALSESTAALAHVVEDRAETELLHSQRSATAVARLAPHAKYRAGDSIRLTMPHGGLRLFDRTTGLAINHPGSSPG